MSFTVDFDVLTLDEDPKRNWRGAYQKGLYEEARQLFRWRSEQGLQTIEVDGYERPVKYATDSQIRECAANRTRVALERAIIQHDQTQGN